MDLVQVDPERRQATNALVIVFVIERARRPHRSHFVAISTWPFSTPVCRSACASASSDLPRPDSAVSNQLIPPASAALTIAFVSSSVKAGQ